MSTLQMVEVFSRKYFFEEGSLQLLHFGKKLIPFGSILFTAFILWNFASPQDLNTSAWHLLIIFTSTIAAIILNILPIGAVALIGMLACVLTQTLSLQNCLKSFGNEIVWLATFSFFVARGVIKSELGTRVAYLLIQFMGKTSLGLAYGLIMVEFILASAIPGNTARGVGIIFPILSSLINEYDNFLKEKKDNKIGGFLIKTCYQANVITSAIFLTALAGNSLIIKLAGNLGVIITWKIWFLGAIIPGIINLILLPLVLYYFYPPNIKFTKNTSLFAQEKLKNLGKIKSEEIIVFLNFCLLVTLWICGSSFGISNAGVTLIGCVVLLCSGVLEWDDILSEKNAWNTLIWFSVLVMMAEFLTEFGFIHWLSSIIQGYSCSYQWWLVLPILSFVYFYSHYLFASSTAHITAMYPTFLSLAIALKTPPLLAAFLFAMLSNLSACLTHYGNGSAPVYYGAGRLSMREWWYLGAIVSFLNLIVWFLIGGIWWKIIGFW